MRISILLVIFCLILCVSFTHATVYHVDTNSGNDSFPGTSEKPFKTIKHGSDILEPGDKLLIHAGVYYEQIMGGKSGLPDKPITYEGVDRDQVILRGSVTVKDWKKAGNLWFKVGLKPLNNGRSFVMVDEKILLKRSSSLQGMSEGSFYFDDNNYYVRLSGDANPNSNHVVDVYELDLAFNAGARWGGTAKKHIILRNMTIEKYGVFGISAQRDQRDLNSHWELDNLKLQYNQAGGVFCALDDWHVHNCEFLRNRCGGIQINGERVRFLNNISNENEWFGHSEYGGTGLLIGPDEWANSCEVKGNTFKDNGFSEGYGCGIYLEGRSQNNIVENNFIEGNTHAGIGFYGSSDNRVINNVIINTAPNNFWHLTAAFVIHHSIEGAPTQSVGNFIAFNTVWGCSAPVALSEPSGPVEPDRMNEFVNNVFANCRNMLPKPKSPVAIFKNNAWFNCPEEGQPRNSNMGDRARRLLQKTLNLGVDTLDTNPVKGSDPLFKDVSRNEFVPLSNSPLVNAGVIVESVKFDIRRTVRPKVPTIGAYEIEDEHSNSLRKR
jgi:parallel beta-helix repeat protein